MFNFVFSSVAKQILNFLSGGAVRSQGVSVQHFEVCARSGGQSIGHKSSELAVFDWKSTRDLSDVREG